MSVTSVYPGLVGERILYAALMVDGVQRGERQVCTMRTTIEDEQMSDEIDRSLTFPTEIGGNVTVSFFTTPQGGYAFCSWDGGWRVANGGTFSLWAAADKPMADVG